MKQFKMKQKNKKEDFLECRTGKEDPKTSKITGRGVMGAGEGKIRTGEGTIRAGECTIRAGQDISSFNWFWHKTY